MEKLIANIDVHGPGRKSPDVQYIKNWAVQELVNSIAPEVSIGTTRRGTTLIPIVATVQQLQVISNEIRELGKVQM